MSRRYRITAATLFSEHVSTRLPFRYGIATMTRLPHVFLELQVEGTSGVARGVAADHLPPKWFSKNPATSFEEDISALRSVIVHAAAQARGRTFDNLFEFWRELWAVQDAWAKIQGHPALLAHFGTSLVERALIDAFCRLENLTFAEAVHRDRLGLDLNALDARLPATWQRLLPAEPLEDVVARHTVGLADDIFEADRVAGVRVDDGLPESLEAAVRAYRLTEFKIKFCGQWAVDQDRLERIFACLSATASADWRFSLDGNESFPDGAAFHDYWLRLTALPWFKPHLGRLLFIEQPLSRVSALEPGADWRRWPEMPPIIIDESDGGLDDVPTALALGYAGSSHKNCKGIIKGILNRCRLAFATHSTGRPLLMSGEDLCNIGPVALGQDLVVQAVLGNASVERNGHHYFRGLSMWPADVQESMLHAHPDLYERTPAGVTLRLREGRLSLASLLAAPFGYAALPDLRSVCSTIEELS